jgi:hypothetical protein
MATGLEAWADDAGGGTPILAADLNTRDQLLTLGGLAGLIPPTSPNAKDDEFDGTSSVTWSNTPTAAATASHNSKSPGRLFLNVASGVGAFGGRVQAVPGGYPYTITTRIAHATIFGNYQKAGIILGPSSPTGSSGMLMGGLQFAGIPQCNRWLGNFNGTFTSGATFVDYIGQSPIYFRATVASATSVTTYVSNDGVTWVTIESAFNPGFTPGVMGLGISDDTGSSRGCAASFDFFRVT